ncbi:MAG: DUF6585 family protein [Planctomycetota bacterium]
MTTAPTQSNSLGQLRKSLRPKTENIIAGYLIAALMLVGSVVLCFTKMIPDAGPRYALAAVLLIAAAGFAFYIRRLAATTVDIYDAGFVVHRGGGDLVFLWSEISVVQERVAVEGLPMKGAAGRASAAISGNESRSYTVVRNDGTKFFFDKNVIPRGSLLAGPLRTAQRTHDFAWETENA